MLKIIKFTLFLLFTFLFSYFAQAKVIKEERSMYRNILVEDKGNLRCLTFSVKKNSSNQSCIFKDNDNKLVFDYTKYIMSAFVFQPKPKRVLIIGLGGGTLSNTLLKLYPNIEIDNVEIDPAVVQVAIEYFKFVQTDKVKSYIKDGRIFIKRALRKEQRYDAIILDAFNGEYIPEHLMSAEFLQETQQLLSDSGIIIANTFSSSALYHHEKATYHHVFGGFYSLVNRHRSGNRILIIDNQPPNKTMLKTNIDALSMPLKMFDIDLPSIMNSLQFEKHETSEHRILTDQYSPANLL